MIVKPISIAESIWYFIISSVLIWLGLYKGIPFLQAKGIPFFAGYLILFYAPFILLLITALVLYHLEGGGWTWNSFAQRTRLVRLTKTDWFWAIGLFVFGAIVYIGFSPIGAILAKLAFFAPPDFFPAEINPNKSRVPGYMMDYRLTGQYWIVVAYFVGWMFNILGEELLWRGMLLPRQVLRYGQKAWIFHGIIWTLWHFFWTWNLVSILPWSLALSYVTYKRQNTWIPIMAHGALNFIPLILIIIEVFS